jgi:hypothetical protein
MGEIMRGIKLYLVGMAYYTIGAVLGYNHTQKGYITISAYVAMFLLGFFSHKLANWIKE